MKNLNSVQLFKFEVRQLTSLVDAARYNINEDKPLSLVQTAIEWAYGYAKNATQVLSVRKSKRADIMADLAKQLDKAAVNANSDKPDTDYLWEVLADVNATLNKYVK